MNWWSLRYLRYDVFESNEQFVVLMEHMNKGLLYDLLSSQLPSEKVSSSPFSGFEVINTVTASIPPPPKSSPPFMTDLLLPSLRTVAEHCHPLHGGG